MKLPWLSRPGRVAVVGCLLALLPPHGGADAQDRPAVSAARVEAAFLRNFARYVGWPARAFASERSAWSVCIVGNGHFDDTLEATFQNRTEQGRAFEVVRGARLEQLPACQIVFVDVAQAAERRAVLARLNRQPVLTVGIAPEFLDEGGIVELLAGERVEMSINLDQARASSLTIPSTMLEVSRSVVENGTLRRWR